MLTFQENGRYGVAFFFVIQRIPYCTLFLREEQKNGRIDLAASMPGARYAFYRSITPPAAPDRARVWLSPPLVENQILFKEKLPAYVFYFSNWLPRPRRVLSFVRGPWP